MDGFFKSFGKGLLYIFVLPFFLIVLAGYAVVGVLIFIFLFFKSIILFFSGRSLKIELPEDVRAKEIIQGSVPNNNVSPDSAPVSNDNVAEQEAPIVEDLPPESEPTDKPQSVEEACFGKPNEPTNEQPKEENKDFANVAPEVNSIQEGEKGNYSETNISQEQTENVGANDNADIKVDEISTDVYSPKKSSYEMNDDIKDDDDDDSSSGVDINFKDF